MKPVSIIIITYNRPKDMLALAQNISQLDGIPEYLEEVIVVNNASTVSYSEFEDFIRTCPEVPFKYFYSDENLGVSRGRNFAIEKGKAPIIVLLDDDAELQHKNSLPMVYEAFKTKNAKETIGIVSFKVLYFETLEMQQNAFPHKKFEERKHEHRFHTYYFAGGANAIQRELFEKVGVFPTDFFYGMEEYDLSYRALDAGYQIVYDDRIVMLHKESPEGRQISSEKWAGAWVNKCKVAYRYLPKRYFYFTAIFWSLAYFKFKNTDLKIWRRSWMQIFRISKTEKRHPISKQTFSYLKAAGARLWY